MSNVEDASSEGENLGSSPPTGDSTAASALMQNPELLAAVQGGLSRLVGQQSGYIQSLPKSVKRRIKALKNLQVSCCKLEGKFYEEVHALECKYAEKFKPYYEKRKSIASGQIEPTDEECNWPSDEETEEHDEEGKTKEEKDENDKTETEVKDKVKVDDEEKVETEELSGRNTRETEEKDHISKPSSSSEDTKGIPEFWLSAMKNVDMVAEMIQEHDEPILKHLQDLKVIFIGPESNVENSQYPLPVPMGFVLEFHFTPNPFFTNSVLTKSYKMKCEPDEDDPFSFEGPEIVSTTGCKIEWKKGKNITQKVIKKKQRHKGRGQTRFVNKTVRNDSFFNFFSPPEVQEDDEELDEDTEALLAADFEIGHFFRERLIPKAVLYFTGEAVEDEFDDEDDEDMDGDGDLGDDDDDDDDPDYSPKQEDQPKECKQQ